MHHWDRIGADFSRFLPVLLTLKNSINPRRDHDASFSLDTNHKWAPESGIMLTKYLPLLAPNTPFRDNNTR
jgi:hypothetical protein